MRSFDFGPQACPTTVVLTPIQTQYPIGSETQAMVAAAEAAKAEGAGAC